jgi:uncharacterized OB-fold protein
MIVEKFLNCLKDSKFVIPYCDRCNAPAWPPVDCCYTCMSKVKLKCTKSLKGHLIEYTTSYHLSKPLVFGIIEIDGIKLVSIPLPHSGNDPKNEELWDIG